MGRKRKSNELDLPPRVYFRHGAFYYAHRDGRWERLGTDVAYARLEGRRRGTNGDHGSLMWWYGEWLTWLRTRIGKPKSERGISQRTYDDYLSAEPKLRTYFKRTVPGNVKPAHVGEYLQIGADSERAVRANREKAALSSCFTWLMLQTEAGVSTNPCIGVRRNPERPRDRYVEDAEYDEVWRSVGKSTRTMMDLIYRTLQRPEDVLRWTTANLGKRDGIGVIRTRQGKTDHRLEIEISAEIDEILTSVGIDRNATVVHLRRPLIYRLDGFEYTYDGITANLKHGIEVANRARAKWNRENPDTSAKPTIASFGFQDLKAKGATDMYQAGVQLELIRELCGHDSVTTTEIYVKRRLRKIIAPNRLKRPAGEAS